MREKINVNESKAERFTSKILIFTIRKKTTLFIRKKAMMNRMKSRMNKMQRYLQKVIKT